MFFKLSGPFLGCSKILLARKSLYIMSLIASRNGYGEAYQLRYSEWFALDFGIYLHEL